LASDVPPRAPEPLDAEPSWLNRFEAFAARTPNRTFIVYPVLVTAWRLLRTGGQPRFAWAFLPVLAWGYLQYRWCGKYRRDLGGGGPGLEHPPEELVTTGPYAYVRNPMYLGHIIFLVGLALLTRSRLAWLIALGTGWWFNLRVEGDEVRLQERFGDGYRAYQRSVNRWIPQLAVATP
jgi:protein-S-isoprenylcysteine O-methyltransferase Ste14